MGAQRRTAILARQLDPSASSAAVASAQSPFDLGAVASTPSRPTSDIGRTQLVEANGVRFHVVLNGEGGTPVLCMPGALGTAESDFAPQLRGLAHRHRVVSFDPRGYGKSRPPVRDFPPDYYHRDADDAHAIMEKLGFPSYNLMGWSDGSLAGVILAAKRPEAVRKLVLIGCGPSVDQHDIDLLEATRDVRATWSQNMLDMLVPIYGVDELQRMWDGLCDAMIDIMARGGDICQKEAQILRCPTLVLAGAKDPIVPVCHAEWLARNVPGARLRTWPDGKHNIHIKYADELNALVLDFFAE